MKTKTIIISSQKENCNARGILTIFSENGTLSCRIRLYNVGSLSKLCKLGIYHENQVFSGNLIENEGVFTCSIIGDFDIDKDFYSAIVDTSNNNEVVLSGGTYAGFYFNDNSIFNDLTYDVEPVLNIESDSPETISIHDCSNCEKCANCEYKKYFFEHNAEQNELYSLSTINSADSSINTSDEIDISNNIENNNPITQIIQPSSFNNQSQNINNSPLNNTANPPKPDNHAESLFNAIIPQFQYIFDNYEANTQLNELIPNSRFVAICEGGENYSIGAIYADNEIRFLCYAVLKESSVNPPPELGEHFQWLPLDREDPLSEGYFVVFQDAHDLKIVEL